ncbi:MAG TPA: hypothetical protein VGC30_03105, partial [Dokdonella sp.]
MDSTRWQRAAAIFDRAVELAPGELDAWLERNCAGDAALRAEVESLLAADAAAATFDARARALRDGAAADWAAANALDGATIGAWRVVGELGRGGMGV